MTDEKRPIGRRHRAGLSIGLQDHAKYMILKHPFGADRNLAIEALRLNFAITESERQRDKALEALEQAVVIAEYWQQRCSEVVEESEELAHCCACRWEHDTDAIPTGKLAQECGFHEALRKRAERVPPPFECGVCRGALMPVPHGDAEALPENKAQPLHADDASPANTDCRRACHRCGRPIWRGVSGTYYHLVDGEMHTGDGPAYIPGVQPRGCERRRGDRRHVNPQVYDQYPNQRSGKERRRVTTAPSLFDPHSGQYLYPGENPHPDERTTPDRRNPNPPEQGGRQGGSGEPPDDKPAQKSSLLSRQELDILLVDDPRKPHQRPVHPRVSEAKPDMEAAAGYANELARVMSTKTAGHNLARAFLAQRDRIAYLEQAAKDQVLATDQQIRGLQADLLALERRLRAAHAMPPASTHWFHRW